jgi:hypothetical protein
MTVFGGSFVRSSWAMRVLLLVLWGGATPAAADEHVVQHWHNVFVQGRLAPSTAPAITSSALYYLEVQPRLSLLPGAPDKVLFRGALGVEAVPALSLWAGIGAIPAWVDGRWIPNETRLWQQVLWTPRLDAFQFLLRGRAEQRSFDGESEVAWRARVLARAVWTPPVDDGRWGLVVFDELFVGVLGLPPARRGFDQNRAFVGVLRRVTPWWSTEGGYLHVQVGLPGSDGARQLHTLLLQTTLNFF